MKRDMTQTVIINMPQAALDRALLNSQARDYQGSFTSLVKAAAKQAPRAKSKAAESESKDEPLGLNFCVEIGLH